MNSACSPKESSKEFALSQLRRKTKDDTGLFRCTSMLYAQGMSLQEVKALIPELIRARELIQFRRIIEENNVQLMAMLKDEFKILIDAKEEKEEERFKKIDRMIRQQMPKKPCADNSPLSKLREFFIPT